MLRPWRPADAPAVAEAYADPGIRQWHVRSMTEDEARAWIDSWPGEWARESGTSWAIADSSGVLGQIGLRRLKLPDGIGGVSYWVLPAARGRRVATRALCTLSTWAFEQLRLHRIELAHSTRNRPPAKSRTTPTTRTREPNEARASTPTAGTTCTYTPA